MTMQELMLFRDKFITYNEHFAKVLLQECMLREEENITLRREIEQLKEKVKYYEEMQQNREQLLPLDEIMVRMAFHYRSENMDKVRELLELILKNTEYYGTMLDETNIFHLLVLAFIYEMDEMFLKAYPQMQAFLTIDQPQSRLIHLIQKEKSVKVNAVVDECVNHFLKDNRKILNTLDGFGKNQIVRLIKQKHPRHCKKVFLVDGIIKRCKEHDMDLQVINAFATLTNQKYILLSLGYCKKCCKFYLSKQECDVIHKELNNMSLVVEEKRDILASKVIGPSNKNIASVSYQEIPEMKLNEQSPMKLLGYDTTKSDSERWRILTQLAIPKLGKNKVIYYLEMFIRMGKNNKQKAKAIEKWEYDLNRLQG